MATIHDDIRWCTERLLIMHSKARVGHLGGNLSCLPGLCTVFAQLGKRDRVVLSKGHSAGALYVVLARFGKLQADELSTFHMDGTRLPGHPPSNIFPAIPFATGSLGHGLSLSAGFALSQKLRNNNAKTYCLTSDGEWQEGATWEALIFACHHRLNNLTILVDHNGLQGFGSTANVASMDPLWEKLAGYDLDLVIVDGHDPDVIQASLSSPQNRLRAIFLRTTKGIGIPGLQGEIASHYLPINVEQYQAAMTNLGSKS